MGRYIRRLCSSTLRELTSGKHTTTSGHLSRFRQISLDRNMGVFKSMDDNLDHGLTRLGYSLNLKYLEYVCASSGLLTGLFFFGAFVAAGFFPPLPPTWTPEEIKDHYVRHQLGMHIGAVLMLISGMFFIPYTAIISAQMRRIPGIPWMLPAMQLAAGAANVFTFCLPAMVLGVGAFRTDWDAKAYQLMNDMFWLFVIMPFQTFVPVSWTLAYAILIDRREKPLYPKYMAILNFFAPPVFFLSIWVHGTKTGPFAWDGIAGFWIPAVFFGAAFAGDTYYLCTAIKHQYEVEGEDDDATSSDCEGGAGRRSANVKSNGSRTLTTTGPVHLD